MNLRTLGLTKILLTFIILSIIGALMIYSASSYDLLMQGVKPTAVFIKQGIIMCLSWVLMFVIYKVLMAETGFQREKSNVVRHSLLHQKKVVEPLTVIVPKLKAVQSQFSY